MSVTNPFFDVSALPYQAPRLILFIRTIIARHLMRVWRKTRK
jgi:hypothetical protein